MKQQTFFKKNMQLNDFGAKTSLELDIMFMDLYNKYIDMGYSIRELTQLLYSSISFVEMKTAVKYSYEYDKMERLERVLKESKESKKTEKV